jgi:hypothetical protein
VTVGAPSYKGFRFPAEIISHCVGLYHRFPLSLPRGRGDDAGTSGTTMTARIPPARAANAKLCPWLPRMAVTRPAGRWRPCVSRSK